MKFKKDSKFKDFIVEYLKAAGLTVLSLIILIYLILKTKDFIKNNNPTFYNSTVLFIKNNEFALVVVMGIVGIFFAIRAMYEASKAFIESKRIYTAVSSFFANYHDATEKIKVLIDNAEKTLKILVSLPAYGIIVKDERFGDVFCTALTERIAQCTNNDLQIEFICFDQNQCSKYEEKLQEPNLKGKSPKYFAYKQNILQGLNNIRVLRRKQKKANFQNIWLLNIDPHIRLFIADDSKAVFGTVPDFTPNDPLEPNIAGFETTDKKMVEILQKLFDKQKSTAYIMSDQYFSEFNFQDQ